MLPLLTDGFGNPHSRSHAYGWAADKAVERARQVRRGGPGETTTKTLC